jgi:Glycosyl hydrolases family 43.
MMVHRGRTILEAAQCDITVALRTQDAKETGVGVRGYLGRMVTVDEWNIGVADLQLEDLVSRERLAATNAVRPPVRWVHKPWFVRFQADPCLMEHEGHLFLYHEDVLFGSNKGRLRCAELAADGTLARRSSPMMRLSHHAAYPYVFKHLGSFYCVPETCTSKRVALYKADAPLGPWRRHSVLLEGVSACDSTIFHFDGRWWLFFTVADADRRTWMTNLHIWHAPDPWGPWEPHRLQPAKVDIHSAQIGRASCRERV